MNKPRLAVAALLLTCLGACTPEPGPTENPTPSPTATAPSTASQSQTPPTPTPSVTEVVPFPDDVTSDTADQAEIRAGWEAYVRVGDKFARDPSLKDLSETQHVTTGQASVDLVQSINTLRSKNLVRKGDPVYRDTKISDPATNDDGVTTATVNYCFDATQMKTVDADSGKEGELTFRETMKVEALLEKMPDGSWRVALVSTEVAPC